jgi:hypothetical protein
VGPETSLELIPANSIGVEVGVAISLPPVHYRSKQLVCCEKDLFTVGALRYLHLFLDGLQPVLYLHGILGLRKSAGVGPQKFAQPRLGWWWCLLLLLWVSL